MKRPLLNDGTAIQVACLAVDWPSAAEPTVPSGW